MSVKLFTAVSIILSMLAAFGIAVSNQQLSMHATLVTLLPLFPLGAIILVSSASVVYSPIFIIYLMALFSNTVRYIILSLNQDLFYLRQTLYGMNLHEFEIGANLFAYGILSLAVGYSLTSLFSTPSALTMRFRQPTDSQTRTLRPWPTIILVAIFTAILLNYLLRTGLLDDFSAKRLLVDDDGNIYRFGPARFVTNIGVIFFQIILVFAIFNRRLPNRWSIIALSTLYIFFYSIVLSKRSTLLISFFPIFLVGLYHIRVKTMSRMLIVGVVVLVTVAIITVERQRTVNNQHIAAEAPWSRPFVEMFLSGNFSGLVATAISTEVIAHTSPMWGRTFVIDPVMQFVPRTMWPDKPEELGGRIREIHQDIGFVSANFSQGGTAPGLISEAWLNFRLPGIVIVMIIYGCLSRLIYEFFLIRWRHDQMSKTIYLSYLPIFTLNWFGGHTARLVLMSVSFFLAALLADYVFSKRKQRKSSSSIGKRAAA